MSNLPPDATVARVSDSSSAPHRLSHERFAPGEVLAGRYRIVSLIGRGGMGEVYRADDLKLGQSVALKHLPERLAADPSALQRLHDEVRTGRQISHPNVCRLYDIVEAGRDQFIAMEYVDGEDLASLLRRIGRLPGDKALELARGICAGLAAAHERGFIHRDLKPANVMIDGRGAARIMDFGLAALADDRVQLADSSGTPSYMAPEQLAGRPASVMSDIYSLGLVLYEMFTGRRLFDAETVQALREQHGMTKTRPSSIVSDIDPAVERVMLRCLEEDPAARPASVHAVIAALPGGDPLMAAMAAGETPSPAMVAAAGTVGDLEPARAWTFVAVLIISGIAAAWLSEKANLTGYVKDVRSRAGLTERARAVVAALEPELRAADRTGWFGTDNPYLRSLAPTARQHRWSVLAETPPSAVLFRYRQSPRPMVPIDTVGRVKNEDPPFSLPGMVSVTLDQEGRLRHFERIPPVTTDAPPSPYDWGVAFREAGLDPARFETVTPRWTPSVGSDRRYAWSGTYTEKPDMPLRVEAASRGGRPVFFFVIEPWRSGEVPPPSASNSIFAGVALSLLIAGAVFAWRNLVRGRADIRGATRAAAVVGALFFLARLCALHYAGGFGEVYGVLVPTFATYGLYNGMLCWLAYLAFEPYVRRRWPHILIGWTRALNGRFSDPLVGSNILMGMAAGGAAFVITRMILAGAVLQGLMTPANPLGHIANNAVFGVGYIITYNIAFGAISALANLLFVLLFRAVTGSDRAAFLLLIPLGAVVHAASTFPASATPIEFAAGAAASVVTVWVLWKWGALALAAALAMIRILSTVPLTLSTSESYAPAMIGVGLVVLAIAGYAFHASLGGKPLLGTAALEDEAAL
jgi:hypothetical protein